MPKTALSHKHLLHPRSLINFDGEKKTRIEWGNMTRSCKKCWYYVPEPTTNKILDDSETVKKFPHCEFYNDLPSVKSDDMCENWESKKLKLISVIKTLYGL